MNRKLAAFIKEAFEIGTIRPTLPANNEIDIRLQQRATDQTAEYVEKHMMHVNSFPHHFDVMAEAVKQITIHDGLFLEFGVYSGTSVNFISNLVSAQIHGFDSFEGLPEFWRDGYDKSAFDLAGHLPPVNSNVKLYRGWFDQTLPPFIKEHTGPIALLHVDCDLYSSTKTIFECLRSQIVPGTVIVFDEYFNYPGWQQGEYKAFQEYVSESNIQYEYLTYNRKHEQVAVRIR